MASMQRETIAHLFNEGQRKGVNLRKGEYDAFDISEIQSKTDKLTTSVALCGTARDIIPGIGNLSWGVFRLGKPKEGLKLENYEGPRRQCHVGILVCKGQFELLEIPDILPEHEGRFTRLDETGIVVPAVYNRLLSPAAA